jgi:hypothetical protein
MKRIFVGSLFIAAVMCVTLLESQQVMAAGSSCGARKGRLATKHEHQLPSMWCWVATTSEVLKWFKFKNANQCDLYDIANGTQVCKEMKKGGYGWVNEYNHGGTPEDAASNYDARYGGSLITVTKKSAHMSYEEVVEQICPSDGSSGAPFIWTYLKVPGHPFEGVHDVVIMGYSNLSKEGGTKLYGDWLRVHDPNELNMSLVTHDMYSGEHYFYDVMIAKK